MQIETKYNIGDKVWILNAHRTAMQIQINHIEIRINESKDDNEDFDYTIVYGGYGRFEQDGKYCWSQEADEDECFDTLEQLFDNIKKTAESF